MNDRDLRLRLNAAIVAALAAGALMRRARGGAGQRVLGVKGKQDFVTRTDGACERLIRAELAACFPDDGFLGEETGGAPGETVWVVDPIDGTINFLRGLPHFVVSIALYHRGRTELGVIYNPTTDELFTARRGHGALLNHRPIGVSRCASLGVARIAAGYTQRGSRRRHVALVDSLLKSGADLVQVNSAASCLAMVAAGRIDGYCEKELRSWDILAGMLLVREAGGHASADPPPRRLARLLPVLACAPRLRQALERASGIA